MNAYAFDGSRTATSACRCHRTVSRRTHTRSIEAGASIVTVSRPSGKSGPSKCARPVTSVTVTHAASASGPRSHAEIKRKRVGAFGGSGRISEDGDASSPLPLEDAGGRSVRGGAGSVLGCTAPRLPDEDLGRLGMELVA